jgi:hypothetical protein
VYRQSASGPPFLVTEVTVRAGGPAFDFGSLGAPSLTLFKGGVLGLLVLERFFHLPKKRFQFRLHRSRPSM